MVVGVFVGPATTDVGVDVGTGGVLVTTGVKVAGSFGKNRGGNSLSVEAIL